MLIKLNDREVDVKSVKMQNYKRWSKGFCFEPAGSSYHYDYTGDGKSVANALSMLTTPNLLIGAFERECLVCDGPMQDVDIETLGDDLKKRLPYAIGNGRYGIYYDEFGNFITMDMTPLWADFAQFVPNVSDQGQLKVICATYMINHQGKESDCYSLHADLMDFEAFIKENDGMTHGYIKVKYETLIRAYNVKNQKHEHWDKARHEKTNVACYLKESGEYRRKYPADVISELRPNMSSKILHSPNQKQHFGIVYETVVDKTTAMHVLSASPGLFVYDRPPKGIIPVSSNGTMLHNPKDFCNL